MRLSKGFLAVLEKRAYTAKTRARLGEKAPPLAQLAQTRAKADARLASLCRAFQSGKSIHEIELRSNYPNRRFSRAFHFNGSSTKFPRRTLDEKTFADMSDWAAGRGPQSVTSTTRTLQLEQNFVDYVRDCAWLQETAEGPASSLYRDSAYKALEAFNLWGLSLDAISPRRAVFATRRLFRRLHYKSLAQSCFRAKERFEKSTLQRAALPESDEELTQFITVEEHEPLLPGFHPVWTCTFVRRLAYGVHRIEMLPFWGTLVGRHPRLAITGEISAFTQNSIILPVGPNLELSVKFNGGLSMTRACALPLLDAHGSRSNGRLAFTAKRLNP